MRAPRSILPALIPLVALAACGDESPSNPSSSTTTASTSTGSGGLGGGGGGAGGDPEAFYYPPPHSCAYECDETPGCAEQTAPYACPTVHPWAAIPHGDACPAWDGTYPAATAGKCTASAPSGEAAKRAGPDAAGHVLPDGRRLHPAGKEWILGDVAGGLTSQVVDVPGTSFVITVETGYGDHAVRAVDVDRLSQGQDPVVSKVVFAATESLNWGMALSGARLFVSSNDGAVHAVAVDLATGALTRDDAHAVPVPAGPKGKRYVSGVAASPDGKKLVVTSVETAEMLVFSIAEGDMFGALLATVPLAGPETFGAWFDPHDAAGSTAYVSLWGGKAVQAVDLAAGVVKSTYATDKNPQGVAFLDARFMIVADANGDSLSLVDRVSGSVSSVPIDVAPGALHGAEPAVLAVDPSTSRVYVALGGDNAVAAFDVDTAQSPPTVTRVGALGTGFWPSGVVVRADGALVVTTLRGHGGGPIPMPFTFGDSDIGERMKGSVQWIPKPAAPELSAGEAQVASDGAPGTRPGAPAVSCPQGAADFPLPETNQGGSPVIEHVWFILRENKNFDSVFGDLAGVDGEPSYTLKASSADMDAIWHNLRGAARGFTVSDNYYTDAVFSTQGHVLATYGRSSDFNERTWAISGPRPGSPRVIPGGGIQLAGMPLEGSLFDWLFASGVPFDILGEADGAPRLPPGTKSPLDGRYPGLVQSITGNDLPKACYAAGRVRVACDVGRFVYQTLSNDHTVGLTTSASAPEVMCAVNDEATGIMLDAISHSPMWKSTLVIITEDDPSSGGEHVDAHRTPLVLVSPWVKRGYVSKTHIDVASLHKLYAHVFGKPYPNRQVAAAMLPFDAFTATPDYTPFTYTPRSWPLSCGMNGAPVPRGEEELTAMWDFTHEDRQPGLAAQVVRAMRGRPLAELTPAMRARAQRWQAAAKARDDE